MAETRALTVLIVDDDPDVLEIGAAVLLAEGLEVVRADGAASALRILESERKIDLLFTDVVMPGGIDGFELARRARRMRDGLPVIYTSGFFNSVPTGQSGSGYGPLLAKPWRADALARAVRDLLQI
jgi:CheY-like chemotaxis protein